jgi:C-terminal processing protease CtpA/Prc
VAFGVSVICWFASIAALVPTRVNAAQDSKNAAFRRLSLAAVGRMWGVVRFQHPYAAMRPDVWDGALLAALPLAERARNDGEVVAAIGAMLGHLKDPLTRVVPAPEPLSAAAPPPPDELFAARRGKTLLVDLTRPIAYPDWPTRIEEIRVAMSYAKGVLFDLRGSSGPAGDLVAGQLERLIPDLLARDVALPGERSLLHVGYGAQTSPGVGGESTFIMKPAEQLQARAGTPRRRVAFVLDRHSAVPRLALALQASGNGLVILQGGALEEQLVTTTLPLSGTASAVVLRVRELATADGRKVAADVSLPADAPRGRALVLATDWITGRAPARALAPRPRAALAALVWRADPAYDAGVVPDRAHRLLALFRLSSVIERFFPYRSLLDKPWAELVDEFIPRFEAAEGRRDYELTLLELAARLADGHAAVTGGKELDQVFGTALPPFVAQMIDGRPVVTGLRDGKEAGAAGVRLGDVLLAVDDVPVAQRMRDLQGYVPAPNAGWRQFTTLRLALQGKDGSTARLKVQRAGGREETLEVVRKYDWWRRPQRSGPIVKVLEGNIGYVDLDRLPIEGVSEMFRTLKATRGIVFDMRGYPQATGLEIAARMNTRRAAVGALVRCPVVRGAGDHGGESLALDASIPATGEAPYLGKTAMLIDERAMSQAETTGLLFEAAAGTRFVGSASAGSNGDITSVTLPGALAVTFSGNEVRHADGRQLQRVGLRPDVEARPTIEGLRAGRDEVLNRALELLGK